MVQITLDLIRKRSEHNEGEISTLEEIALHQEHIEKIELLNRVCKDLKILLLQNNLIARIENLNRLKNLQYLNLALNNIEVIENLEGLESLRKLDLTVNFIGDVRDVRGLRCNESLEQLILTGNPCCDYENYREFVVATLPQLKELDMKEIERSERIKALQVYSQASDEVTRGYRRYREFRDKQKIESRRKSSQKETEGDEGEDSFWNSSSLHTPEDRIAISEKLLKIEEEKSSSKNTDCPEKNRKYSLKLFSKEGKPYNVNQPKVPFVLNDEDDRENVLLEVSVYKHLDTSYLDVDVQPRYVRVTVKGKVLQLTLPCEVKVDQSAVKRNVVTGSLVVTMPRVEPERILTKPGPPVRGPAGDRTQSGDKVTGRGFGCKREYLEIGPRDDRLDFANIVGKERVKGQQPLGGAAFVDCHPEVPPLE